MFQHSSLSYYVPHAFRPHHLLFPDVLERKGQSGVFSLHDSYFAECLPRISPSVHVFISDMYSLIPTYAFADDSQQPKVIQLDLVCEDDCLPLRIPHVCERRAVETVVCCTGAMVSMLAQTEED